MIAQADAVKIPLADKSVHCAVTSPPYWGLRKYAGEQGRIWGGDPECEHEWTKFDRPGMSGGPSKKQESNVGSWHKPHSQASCESCNAWYGSLGLEPTPEQHTENIVEICREVRRVLRDDGVFWLNYGDCYSAAGWESNRRSVVGQGSFDPAERKSGKNPGTRAGSLMMMPHRVALALQQPYYLGRIKKELDRVWLAAMVEAEGCIHIHRRPAGQKSGDYIRKNDTYTPGVEVANTNPEIAKRCASISGYVGGTCRQTPKQNPRRDQTIYRWVVRGDQCRNMLKELYPYMVTESKKAQVRIALGSPTNGDKAKTSWESLKALHKGKDPTIDFPPPKNGELWEPGWIVRGDPVWSKSNPMPESINGTRWIKHRIKEKRSKHASDHNIKGGTEAMLRDASIHQGIDEDWVPEYIDCPGCEKCIPNDGLVLKRGSWRHTRAHEYVFMLTKKMQYWSNQEAARVRHDDPKRGMKGNLAGGSRVEGFEKEQFTKKWKVEDDNNRQYNPGGRNPRSVLDVPTAPYRHAHYATYPPNLIAPLIRATCPRRCCPVCGQGWAAVVDKSTSFEGGSGKAGRGVGDIAGKHQEIETLHSGDGHDVRLGPVVHSSVLGYRPTCSHEHTQEEAVPGICFDPFVGSGTTVKVAQDLLRRGIGLDISMEYLDLQAKVRIGQGSPSNVLDDLPLFQ